MVSLPKKKSLIILFTQTALLLLFMFTSLVSNSQPVFNEVDTSTYGVVDEEVELVEKDARADTAWGRFIPIANQVSGGGPDSLSLRSLPQSKMQELRADEDFWYANYVFTKKEQKPPKRSFTDGQLFQTVLWIVIILTFLAALFMYLSNSNVRLFRKDRYIARGEQNHETEDIFSINYDKEIEKAVNSGNYRLAVRLQFLHLLRKLSDRNIIQYKHDRTNMDYLLQMNSSSWYPEFFRLTRSYEYSWYGLFHIDSDKYAVIKNDFENFDRKLR